MPSLYGNLSPPKFDVDMEQSPLLVVLKIVVSFLSPPLPRIVLDLGTRSLVGGVACNSPDFTKIKKIVFGVNCLIV